MPVEIDSDTRPGSAIPSPNGVVNNIVGGINMNAAGGVSPPPIRPTTTSRRGGRSRSPVSGVQRIPPPNINNAVGPPESNDNPSSAAAAAAAAAKAYSTRRGPWQMHPNEMASSEDGPLPQHRSMYGSSKLPPPSSYPPSHHPPPSGWPGDESAAGMYRPRNGASGYSGYDHHRSPPPYHDEYDRRYHQHHHHRETPPRYDERRYRGSQRGMPPTSYQHPDYHRYGGSSPNGHSVSPHHTSHHPNNRGTASPPSSSPQHHPPIQSPPDYRGSRVPYRHRPDMPPLTGRPGIRELNVSPSHRVDGHSGSGGVTTLVMGGTTPIHLPKSPLVSNSSKKQQSSSSGHIQQPRDGSAASVFRGRVEVTSPNPDDKNSPENILLSMRTPSTSFEEIKDNNGTIKTLTSKKSNGTILELGQSPPSNNSQRLEAIFERQRSSEGIRADGSIDIAPSFPFLLNQSFDSFGDSFNVESTLQNDSFGFGRVDSTGNDGTATSGTQQVLRKNSSSGGNYSTPFLAPSGSGGALTIGYSPVNSFGNTPSAPRSNIMVVGGHDPRSSSPTVGLEMYRSYSGGTNATRPLDDSHFRMSVGSFGAQSMSAGYNRSSYGDPVASPRSYYTEPMRSIEPTDRLPSFYVVLRKFRTAFKDCIFLLPGVKSISDAEAGDSKIDEPSSSGGHPYQTGQVLYGEPTPLDIAIARRRIESSICAFGGNLNRGSAKARALDSRESIFRSKEPKDSKLTTATQVSTDSPNGVQSQIEAIRTKYEDALPSRYYENESRLSWEFEEQPPVELLPEDDQATDESENAQTANKAKGLESKDDKTATSDDDQYCVSINEDTDAASTDKNSSSPQAKMRYRCKLCGQPKQNHTCPYQQALARSIGTMVYPAVNAFTADEPGTIAAPLSEMNNFVDIQKDGSEASPMRPSPERIRSMNTGPMSPSAQVTPETMRSGARHIRSSTSRHGNRKRMYSQFKGSADHGDLLFVEAMELKLEQFRDVTQSKSRKASEGYIYPALPLPYAQRKRLSDNLFSLSNDVPKLTDECAQVLREAREKDMWDLAVAELMTQVIVIIHCSERDFRFEGLRQYLLTLGIAC